MNSMFTELVAMKRKCGNFQSGLLISTEPYYERLAKSMKLLTDRELVDRLTGPDPFVSGVSEPIDWFAADSPVQPCSLDLRIGDIFLPETKSGQGGSEKSPLTRHALRPGQTAVATTLERLEFPSDFCAIAFPPSRVSFEGILMTNPGHIDPGYHGKMRFTLINMAKEIYWLERGKPIVTLCMFKLSAGPSCDFRERRQCVPAAAPSSLRNKFYEALARIWRFGRQPSTMVIQPTLDRLSADFVNVERRARTVAKGIFAKTTTISVLAAALITAGGSLLTTRVSQSQEIKGLHDQIDRIEADMRKLRESSAMSVR